MGGWGCGLGHRSCISGLFSGRLEGWIEWAWGIRGSAVPPRRAGTEPSEGREQAPSRPGGCQHSGQLRGLGEGVMMCLAGVKAPELQPLEGWGWPGLPSHATGGGTGSDRAMQGLLAPSHAEVALGTQP